jgi:hypothetical protein
MPSPFLLKPISTKCLPWPSLAEDLGAEVIDYARPTPKGGRRIAFLEEGSPSDVMAESNLTLFVPPETSLGALNAFEYRRCSGAIGRLVLHTPMHHLYALERLGFPPQRLELIPWASHPLARPPTLRESGLLVVVDFVGAEKDLARRSGLGRSSRVELLASADPTIRGELLARASVVVIAPSQQECGSGTRELLDAMALGAPIVYTRTWGLEHLIVPDVEGIEVSVGDLVSLRKESERLLGNPEESLRLGMQAALKHKTTLTDRHYLARVRRIIAHDEEDSGPEFYLIPAHNHVREAAPL